MPQTSLKTKTKMLFLVVAPKQFRDGYLALFELIPDGIIDVLWVSDPPASISAETQRPYMVLDGFCQAHVVL